MNTIINVTDKLKIESRVRDMCKLPYPGHPNGCINYGNRPECPPEVCMVDEFINLSESHWMIIQIFNLAEHAKYMKEKHPEWSERQCKNLYYWQNTVRSKLKHKCEEYCNNNPGTIYTLLPEAMGVNVFRTLIPLGIKMKVRPEYIVYKVALIGYEANQEGLKEFI